MQSGLKVVIDEDRDTLIQNQQVARRHSLLLLYARYVCFRVFLECAAAMTGGITENHKLRWLLIQVAPKTLLDAPDIFSRCTRVAKTASRDSLELLIQRESYEINKYLPRESTLFCVLDEAQTLTKDKRFFRWDPIRGKSSEPRPILREILSSWSLQLPLIVSGTGISMTAVQEFTGSMVAKEGSGSPKPVTEVGGFDDEAGRRTYLEKYFPPGTLDTPEGEEIVSRVGYWLRGRFVFNAAV